MERTHAEAAETLHARRKESAGCAEHSQEEVLAGFDPTRARKRKDDDEAYDWRQSNETSGKVKQRPTR